MDKDQNNYFSSISILSKNNATPPPPLPNKWTYNALLADKVVEGL